MTGQDPMGDNDGSSEQVQNAPSDNETDQQTDDGGARSGGFFSRVMEALSPSEAEAEEGAPDHEDSVSFRGMINLRRMRVDDVAIPKADITAVPVTSDLEELVAVFKESGLTRLPVYDGTLDTPVGMAHLKDLALTHGFNGNTTPFDLKALLRPLVFVPPSMTIGVLLTNEDLIEQVIGEIEDEHDVDEGKYWTIEKPGVYLALAKTPLEDFEAEIGHSLTDHDAVDEEEIDTLGGLVFMLSGRVPARGEVVLHPDGPEFEVIEADPRRVKRLRVRTQGPNG